MKSFELTTETTVEQVPYLERISNFNAAEKANNLKELAAHGFDKIKSIFQRIDIKNALHSLLQKSSDTPTISDTSEATQKSQEMPVTIENASDTNTENVLTELDVSSPTYLQAQIFEYYTEDTNMKNAVQNKLSDRGIPEDQLPEKTLYLLDSFAKGSVNKFENTVAQQLEDYGLNKDEIENYWQWRVQQNTDAPTETSFVRTDNGDRIVTDDFVTEDYIAQYRTQQASPMSEDFLQNLTTKDIENHIDQVMDEFTSENIEEPAKEQESDQLAYNIEKQSDGWINNAMYETVAKIPAGEALYMLGSINAELKPSSRKLLSEMRNTLDTDQSSQTFDDLAKNIVNTATNTQSSEKTLRSLSDIVNKLNKVAVLSEQK